MYIDPIVVYMQVGYTRARQVHSNVLQRVKKEDPAEFSIMTHPHQYTRYTQPTCMAI